MISFRQHHTISAPYTLPIPSTHDVIVTTSAIPYPHLHQNKHYFITSKTAMQYLLLFSLESEMQFLCLVCTSLIRKIVLYVVVVFKR